ncbi:MAG TPA: GNAT family N-acetyltransferase [Candidatus Dietzia intestinipullorum]|nr:GNAT family N-acetyltransferase [Candidatus Dietzia merdigallinarum]HJC28207.1 GNAT family N-acetyltransferase [Candidatus Dietzia intestinipullorum]
MDSPDIVVRRASRSDVDLVLSASALLSTPPTAEWTTDFLDRGSNLLLLALLDDTPVGMLVAVETGHLGSSPDLFVYGIRVREDLRNRGIAHKLVDKAVAVAEDSGCRNVWGSMERGEHLQEDSPLAATAPESGLTTFTIPIP